jgi:GNAT superfamily N-acetyltransferase
MSTLSDPFQLDLAQLDACQRLSSEAGWNQNEADWSFILKHGIGLGIARGERLIATAGIVTYGQRFGWICMVLVTASERRNGLASRLLRACIAWLDARGAIAGLDATPAGREVYRRLGFCDVYPVTRFQRVAEPASIGHRVREVPVRSITEADMAAIFAFDRVAFGEDRRALLSDWWRRIPHAALVAPGSDGPAGYVFAREGRVATQIGPLVARDTTVADTLLRACLAQVNGAVFVDVPDRHSELMQCLASLGFSAQRNFTRMLLGRAEPLDTPEQIFVLTGPEFG